MIASNTFTKKLKKSKKHEVNEDLSKNNHQKLKYRKRLQQDAETLQELKEYAGRRDL